MDIKRSYRTWRMETMKREQRARNVAPKEVTYRGWTMAAVMLFVVLTWAGMLIGNRTVVNISTVAILFGLVAFLAINFRVGRKVREAGLR